ncbi:hypothetical protein HDV63DRAFT_364740 [Trichoderma sp. SZMC 28014]
MLRLARQRPYRATQSTAFSALSAFLLLFYFCRLAFILLPDRLESLVRNDFAAWQPVFFFVLPCSSILILSPELLNLAKVHSLLFSAFMPPPCSIRLALVTKH